MIRTRHVRDLAAAEREAVRAYGLAELRARWLHDGRDTVEIHARTDSGTWEHVGSGRGPRAALRSAAATLASIADGHAVLTTD